MKLDNELAECEAEVADLRSQNNKLTKLVRQLVAALRNDDPVLFKALLLLAEDV